RRHTRVSRDWSSDVCSSDLVRVAGLPRIDFTARPQPIDRQRLQELALIVPGGAVTSLVEEFRIVKRQILLAAREAREEGAASAQIGRESRRERMLLAWTAST